MNTPENEVIYCDESGFTGNDLFSPEQPFFVYSSVLLAPSYAFEIKEKAIRDFKIQGGELKGKSLLRSRSGREAVIWLLEHIVNKSIVIAFDKKIALASAFFISPLIWKSVIKLCSDCRPEC